jgi:hypothetical protein
MNSIKHIYTNVNVRSRSKTRSKTKSKTRSKTRIYYPTIKNIKIKPKSPDISVVKCQYIKDNGKKCQHNATFKIDLSPNKIKLYIFLYDHGLLHYYFVCKQHAKILSVTNIVTAIYHLLPLYAFKDLTYDEYSFLDHKYLDEKSKAIKG